jgi:hypothetical protein
MVIVPNLTVYANLQVHPQDAKNWQNFLCVIGGHLKKVRLPLLQGKHLAFFAGILKLHKVTHQFFTRTKALRWGHNQYSESALGSTSGRILLLVTPLVFGPYLPQNIDAPASTLEPCIIFHLIAKEVATSSTLQSYTKRYVV